MFERFRMSKYGAVIIAVAAVSAILGGCTNEYVTERVEKGIAKKLPELIGPAESYKVDVDGSTARMMKGKINRIEITAYKVKPANKYYLDELNIVLTGVRADPDKQTLESVEKTVFTATITEPSLNKYLRETRPDLKDLKIDLRSSQMLVHTRPAAYKLSASVDLLGKLQIASSRLLNFKVNRLTVAGLKTPQFAANYVEDKINPVLDVVSFGFPAKLQSVNVTPEKVTLNGTADLSKGLGNGGK